MDPNPICRVDVIELTEHGPLSRRDEFIRTAVLSMPYSDGWRLFSEYAHDVVVLADDLLAEADKEEPKNG